jgi:hypothetical protein
LRQKTVREQQKGKNPQKMFHKVRFVMVIWKVYQGEYTLNIVKRLEKPLYRCSIVEPLTPE